MGGAVPAVPIERRAWLALQILRTPDAYTDAELRPALVAGLRRLRRRLRQEKIPNRPLDREDLLQVTAALAGLGPDTDAGSSRPRPPALARERWRSWTAGGSVQSSHKLISWPQLDSEFDRLVCGLPATAVALAITLMRDPAEIDDGEHIVAECAVRVSAPDPRQLATAENVLARSLRRSGGRSEPLSGEQRVGLAATLPLGGFIR